MPKIVTLKCDKCGMEEVNGTGVDRAVHKFYSLCVVFCEGDYLAISDGYIPNNTKRGTKKVLWCRDCAQAVIPSPEERNKEETLPTFEELLREMVAQEVQSQLQNQ